MANMNNIKFIGYLILLLLTPTALAYDYDPNDFATEVVSYTPGMGIISDYLTYYWEGIFVPYDNPDVALGRPTIDTTGDKTPAGLGFIDYSEIVPVVSVYPAFRAYPAASGGINYAGYSIFIIHNERIY